MAIQRRALVSIVALSAALIIALVVVTGRSSTARVALPTWTVPSLPDTPAGRQLEAYLAVFNGDSEEDIRAFIAENFTPVGPGGADLATRTRSQLQLHQTSRGLNLYEVAESRDHAVSVIAQLRLTQDWRRMTYMVEGQPPHRISGIMIQPVDPPAGLTAAPRNEDEFTEQLDDYIRSLVEADQFSGVVLVARNGDPLFEKAYGMADHEQNIPNSPATRFSFASVGKMFTALAVAQLADAGKLSFDDTISRHLAEYSGDVAERLTLDQLLTHRSGLMDFFAEAEKFERANDSADPQKAYLDILMQEPLRFGPGERFEYSNSNYLILGAVIERISGLPFSDYLQKYVFEPAGMSQTSLSATSHEGAVVANGYTRLGEHKQVESGPRRLFEKLHVGYGGPAGGGYTTVRDLLSFDRALRSSRLLSAAASQAVLTERVDYSGRPGYRYGYGFILRRSGHESVAGHKGGYPGVDAQFEMYLERGYTVAILSNYELVAEPIVLRIEGLLQGLPAPRA